MPNPIPIYTAIKTEKVALPGTTNPCLMSVNDNDGNYKGIYHVKLFKSSYLSSGYYPLHMEVIGNLLAKEFGLNTPDIALISISQTLIKEILKEVPYSNYRPYELSSGLYFGASYIGGGTDANPSIFKSSDIEDLSIIFAFDNMVLHRDRRENKPNLFLNKGEIVLIDHESILALSGYNYNQLIKQGEYFKANRPHLFLSNLARNKNKVDFATFGEYLKYMNINLLDDYVDQLDLIHKERFLTHEGDLQFDYPSIKHYLCEVKDDCSGFINKLKHIINQ